MSNLISNSTNNSVGNVTTHLAQKSRIAECFANLATNNKKALITFITAGDPVDIDIAEIMHALVAGGADIIELGIAFSDPAADGEVIQKASERAISNGVNYNKLFVALAKFRMTDTTTPVVLMGYLNPAETHVDGFAGFCKQSKDSGADALILVDLSFESGAQYRNIIHEAGLELINLITPTTTSARLGKIVESASGFLYYVSMRGVTGKSNKLDINEISISINDIKKVSTLPVCVGFGISDAANAKNMADLADGIIIGSALVKTLYNSAQNKENVCQAAKQFVLDIKTGMNS